MNIVKYDYCPNFIIVNVLRVTCHLLHVTNANNHSHWPSPCWLPQYAQQDAAADLNLDPSTMSDEGP